MTFVEISNAKYRFLEEELELLKKESCCSFFTVSLKNRLVSLSLDFSLGPPFYLRLFNTKIPARAFLIQGRRLFTQRLLLVAPYNTPTGSCRLHES